ncbi:transposase [Streptomyces sp. NPDC005784]|uniref:transposase n=1 Tax=Streptomyces sp. NPDC005784 TaxID=3364731 RepID=UPI0036A51A8C
MANSPPGEETRSSRGPSSTEPRRSSRGLCAAHRDRLGTPAAGTRLGLRYDLLETTQLVPLLQAVPPVRGRPRHHPDVVLGDRGYDHDKYRRLVRDLGVKLPIARRGTEHGSGLGAQRWVVERTFAHLHWFCRLRIRWEIRDDIRRVA